MIRMIVRDSLGERIPDFHSPTSFPSLKQFISGRLQEAMAQILGRAMEATLLADERSMYCRVMLVDDHNLVRVALRRLLEHLDGVEVVGEAEDGGHAVVRATRLRPDLVLMDVTLGSMNGIEALTRLRQSAPDVRVMMLSMNDSLDTVLQALRFGACGYLLKSAEVVELELAIWAVMRGERYFSPAVSKLLADRLMQVPDQPPKPSPAPHHSLLTRRQTQILELIGRGKTSREIASEQGLSVKTVESHRAHIMRRLNIHDVAGLVLYAVRHGLVPLD